MKSRKGREKPCVNCHTTRYPIKAKGYCSRCYPITLRLEHTKRWDPAKPETLRHYPKSNVDIILRTGEKIKNYYSADHWQRYFPQIKLRTIRELQKRLLHFQQIEKKLAGPISGYDIELRLRTLARSSGVRNRHLFQGIAGGVEAYFTRNQRKILFSWLNDISENVKWRGIYHWGGVKTF